MAKEAPDDLAIGRCEVFTDLFHQLQDGLTGEKAALALALLTLIVLTAVWAVSRHRAAVAQGEAAPRTEQFEDQRRRAVERARHHDPAARRRGRPVRAGELAWGLGPAIAAHSALNLIGVVVKLTVTAGMITADSRAIPRRLAADRPVRPRRPPSVALIFILMGVACFGKLVEVLAETVGASLQVSVAARGLFALLIGLILARGLYGIILSPDARNEAGGKPANIADESPFWAPIRLFSWFATFAIIGSALLGYVALSAFLVNQLAWMAFVGGVLFLLLKLSDGATEQAFRPASRMSRNLTATIGIGRESLQQIGVLLSGLLTVALSAAALMLVHLPLGRSVP